MRTMRTVWTQVIPPSPRRKKPGQLALECAAMNAVQAIEAAHAAGIRIELDGDQLVLEAPAAPPNCVVDLLARHKFGIIALLRPHRGGWSAEDWQAFFHERAGIAEFDGGLQRPEAETQAFERCV